MTFICGSREINLITDLSLPLLPEAKQPYRSRQGANQVSQRRTSQFNGFDLDPLNFSCLSTGFILVMISTHNIFLHPLD
jgi:hypothetical protein